MVRRGKKLQGRDGKGDLAAMNDMRWIEADPAPQQPPAPSASKEFRALYAESLPYVYGYLLHRVGGNAAVGEDLTQETYVAAVGQLRTSGAPLSVPWLLGVARHKLVDHFRRLAREEAKLTLVTSQPMPDAWKWSDMPADQVLASLNALPSLQRAAVGLRYLDDLPVPEVARLLGRSVHATESLLGRGRDALRRHYLDHADD